MMELEDDYTDIIRKAMYGHKIGKADLATTLDICEERLNAWLDQTKLPSEEESCQIARVLNLAPARFADAVRRRWEPLPVELSFVRRYRQLPRPSHGHVLLEEGSRQAAVIDPAGDAQALVTIVSHLGYRVAYILITHRHPDHCDAAYALATAFPDAKIVMHNADSDAIGELKTRAIHPSESVTLPLGPAEIRALYTPGHTDGSTCYVYGSVVFCGDVLFAGSVGRAAGESTTYGDLLNSVRSKLFTLADETVVMPGHGPPTRIGWERQHNPFFKENARTDLERADGHTVRNL